jgi:16S rRNA (cytosine1402-N4)-methyltransferase
MLEESLKWLDPRPGETIVDATIGYGGHSSAIARKIGPKGRLIGLDLDSQALESTRQLSAEWPCRVDLLHEGFDRLGEVLRDLETGPVQGILADLGVSSPQLDQGERGFSFRHQGPLDMRMDPDSAPSAAEWIARASEEEILRALREFGEEIRARSVARAITRERVKGPIETTEHLVRVVLSCFPDRDRAGKVHPATRTFQALRIVVNQEMERLDGFLAKIPGNLALGGRAVILAYHSLEDRRVKQAFLSWTGRNDPVLSRIPVRGDRLGWAVLLTPKVVKPSLDEIDQNPRARSARLRAVQRTSPS